MLTHPDVAFRDCNDCILFHYTRDGKRELDKRGNPKPRRGLPPPCRTRNGVCHKGTPEDQKSLSDKNWKAYQHYQECRAVGSFPDDAIVRRNAAIISRVEESVREERILLMQVRK